MLDYITGNKFEELATQLSSFNFFKQVIFTRTNMHKFALNYIRHTNKKFILITHSGDESIDEQMFKSRPSNLICWYAQNCSYEHPDLIPIPIGIQNDYGYNADPNLKPIFNENYERWQSTEKITDMVYCNWSNTSNAIRRNLLPKLEQNNVKYVWEHSHTYSRKEYLDEIAKYRFVISPPGSDNHDPIHCDANRTWEVLYTGGIPIVTKSNVFREYGEDFPMIKVNDYSEVTNDLLNSYLYKQFDTNRLYMSYWRNRITKKFNEI